MAVAKTVTLKLVADSADAQRKLDDIYAKAEELGRLNPEIKPKIDKAAATAGLAVLRKELKDTQAQADSLSGATEKTGKGLSALAGSGGIPGGGMGAAIAAGAVLSPMLVTLGFGLGGLALAAAGIIKPIENAAQKTGGLQKNMHLLNAEQQTVARGILGLGAQFHKFEGQLQPTILKDFNAGLHLAGGLLHDVEPVAAATGKALGGLIGQIDAEFRSNNWQSFFGFMAKTAGPDIHLLGNAFVTLTSDLPPLLEALQPVASAILQVVNYTGQAIRLSELASTNFQSLGKSSQKSGDGFNAFTTGLKAAIPGMQAADRFGKELGQGLDILYGNSGPASKGLKETGAQALASAGHIQTLKQAVTALTTAETRSLDTQLAYSNSLITSANDADALRKALKASHDQIGLHTAAERASFGAANTYIGDLEQTAKQSWASGAGTDGAISALKKGLPTLLSAKSDSKQYWQEVQTLVGWLHKLENIKLIHEKVVMTGSGQWSWAVQGAGARGSSPSGGVGPGRGPHQAAAGWRVPGYGGGDRWPILAEGGEAIVPKHLTPAVAPFLKAHGVPGFAAGGLVPSYAGSVAGIVPWGQGNWNATLAQMAASIVAFGRANPPSLGSFPGGGSSGPGAAAAQRYAASILGLYGWGQNQMPPLISLWNQESGWRWNALNPSSGAYGIPQSLPASKMAAAGADWMTNPATQIRWGLGYIRSTYGSPAGAEAHELSAGWYDHGGYLPPGASIAINGTGRPERVGGGNNYTINVHVPVSVNKREIGRQVVEAIREFEKGGGTSWRK